MTGIKKFFKVTNFNFNGKLLLCAKWGKWGILVLRMNIFELLPKSVVKVFLTFYLITDIKKRVKSDWFLFWRKNSYYAQNERNEPFLGQRSPIFNFFLYLMTAIKKRGKEVISDFEEKLTLCSKWDKLDQVF